MACPGTCASPSAWRSTTGRWSTCWRNSWAGPEIVADLRLTDLPPWSFQKEDADDDAAFYAEARLTTHIDDGAIAALTEFYRRALPAGGVVLDLMSSCVSHFPPEIAYAEVIGLGMNAAELAANPRLARWVVQNLNRDPS